MKTNINSSMNNSVQKALSDLRQTHEAKLISRDNDPLIEVKKHHLNNYIDKITEANQIETKRLNTFSKQSIPSNANQGFFKKHLNNVVETKTLTRDNFTGNSNNTVTMPINPTSGAKHCLEKMQWQWQRQFILAYRKSLLYAKFARQS